MGAKLHVIPEGQIFKNVFPVFSGVFLLLTVPRCHCTKHQVETPKTATTRSLSRKQGLKFRHLQVASRKKSMWTDSALVVTSQNV